MSDEVAQSERKLFECPDRGGEFMSNAFTAYLCKQGMERQVIHLSITALPNPLTDLTPGCSVQESVRRSDSFAVWLKSHETK